MKIRSITFFSNPGWPLSDRLIQQAAVFASEARPAFELAGFDVQTIRLATPPFPFILSDCRPETVVDFAKALEDALIPSMFEYIAIGPAWPDDGWGCYRAIPEVIAATENVFASGSVCKGSFQCLCPDKRSSPHYIFQAC